MIDPDDVPDLTHLRQAVDDALEALMEDWSDAVGDQKEDLVEQVRALAATGDTAGLADLAVDSDDVAAILTAAMGELGAWAAADAATENGGEPVEPEESMLGEVAITTATLLAAELAVSASRAALAALGTGRTPNQVAEAVLDDLEDLSDAGARRQFGGALHGTVNAARLATFEAGPVGSLYAHEVNDSNTCVPCSHVDGRFLGTTDDLAQVLRSYPDGAFGGYILCLGGPACRGTIAGVWRPETEEE